MSTNPVQSPISSASQANRSAAWALGGVMLGCALPVFACLLLLVASFAGLASLAGAGADSGMQAGAVTASYVSGPRSGPAVAVIDVSGQIVAGDGSADLLGATGAAASGPIVRAIQAAAADPSVKAILVRIDSPGGSVIGSDEIYHALKRSGKPVIAQMRSLAASGGYYVAMGAEHIVAHPDTLTGSIGVIIAKAVTAGAYAKIAANRQLIRRGANADLYDDQHAWVGEQRAKVEAGVFQVYNTFKVRVATGRKLVYETLDTIANGRVWTGAQALTHGLVDELGDFQRAVEIACGLADLPIDGTVRLQRITAEKEKLLAQPLAAVSTALGLPILRQTSQFVATVITDDPNAFLQQDHHWLLAEGLPKIR